MNEKTKALILYENTIASEEYMELRKKVGWREFPPEEAEAGMDRWIEL